jgi:hypothetical protein
LNQIKLEPNGAIASKNGSPAITAVSDERLKTNIVTVDPAVASAELCALRLVCFDYSAESAAGRARHLQAGIRGGTASWPLTSMMPRWERCPKIGYWPISSSLHRMVTPYHTLDTEASYHLYAAHKHAITRLDAQAAMIAIPSRPDWLPLASLEE